MRGSKKRKVIIGAVIVTLILVTLFVVLQVPRRVRLLFPTEKTIEQDVKKYLKKRYKQDFHVTNIIPPSYEYASYIITVYPYGKPMDEEHKATVQGWEKDGLIVYYDDYAVVKLIPEVKKYIANIVKEQFPENKIHIYFSKEWYENNVDPNITLKELLKNNSGEWMSGIDIQILVYKKDLGKKQFLVEAEKLVEKLVGQNIIGALRIYLMYNYNIYDSLPEGLTRNVNIGTRGKEYIYVWTYICQDKKISELELEDKE